MAWENFHESWTSGMPTYRYVSMRKSTGIVHHFKKKLVSSLTEMPVRSSLKVVCSVPSLGEMYSIPLYVIHVVCRVFFYDNSGFSINEALRYGITEVFLDEEFNTHNLNN